MKRIFLLFLVFVYMLPTIGFSVTTHYCGGKLSTISLFSFGVDCCKCGKKSMKKNCCTNKVTRVKLKDNQSIIKKISFSRVNFSKGQRYIPTTSFLFTRTYLQKKSVFYHPPGFCHLKPVYLLNEVFRI